MVRSHKILIRISYFFGVVDTRLSHLASLFSLGFGGIHHMGNIGHCAVYISIVQDTEKRKSVELARNDLWDKYSITF